MANKRSENQQKLNYFIILYIRIVSILKSQKTTNQISIILNKFKMQPGLQSQISDRFITPHYLEIGFHGVPMMVSWLPVINMAVIIGSLRWSKYSFFAHLILALTVIGLSLSACIHLLVDYWFAVPPGDYILTIHKICGFTMLIWLGIEFITGWMARLVQFPKRYVPNVSYWTKRVHIFLSYVVMLIAKFNYYIIQFGTHGEFDPIFFLLFVSDLVCLSVYLWIKSSYWTLSEQTIDSQLTIPLYNKDSNFVSRFFLSIAKAIKNVYAEIVQKSINLPERRQVDANYKSQSEIKLDNYVLFNDYVYDTTKLKWFHPGGEQVIQLVNKRQVDRFLYGCYTLQIFSNMKKQSHTKDSLRLVGLPVAKIIRNPPMKGLVEFSKCQVISCNKISSAGKTYLINLNPINTLTLSFQGFESQNQFSQYFSLTIGNKNGRKRCTRLYTTIWCMRRQNIRFHENTFPQFSLLTSFNKPRFTQIQLNNNLDAELSQRTQKRRQSIPLVLKRYQKGELTSRFLNQGKTFDGEVVISEPMGAGLKYDTVSQTGLIVIICGGTGLLPFCDLIDILFKRVKYLESPQLSETLQRRDPLVKKDIIKQRQFIMYCAVENPQQLPVLSLYQLNELSGSSNIKFKTIMRASKEQEMIKKDFKNISLQKEYFESQVKAHTGQTDLAQVYICGPPNMNERMGKLMMEKKVDQKLYHFV